MDRFLQHVRDEMKAVKFLVNAAGVFSPKSFLEHTIEDYNAYLDLSKVIFLSASEPRRTCQ